MKEIELKSINAVQIFKILTIIIAISLLLIGTIVSLYGLFIQGFAKFLNGIFGTFALVAIMAPIYALVAAITAGVYNFIANLVGGFKITINTEDKSE